MICYNIHITKTPCFAMSQITRISQTISVSGHRESQALGRHRPHHPRLWSCGERPEPTLPRATTGGREDTETGGTGSQIL